MLFWNPPKEAFTLPFIDLSVAWYGILFASAFFFGYFIACHFLQRFLNESLFYSREQAKKDARSISDKILLYTAAGAIIGARLGEVFFYHFDFYLHNPMQIFFLRQGGLSSHGGSVGIILALLLLRWRIRQRYPQLTVLRLLDCIAPAVTFGAALIRVGNFMNQELVGTITDVPWAVFFAQPLDNVMPAFRHPVQLYEALAYLITFFLFLWKWSALYRDGAMIGFLFIMIFGARFLLEPFKVAQGGLESYMIGLTTGQLLSIPFILIGCYLIVRAYVSRSRPPAKSP